MFFVSVYSKNFDLFSVKKNIASLSFNFSETYSLNYVLFSVNETDIVKIGLINSPKLNVGK